MTPGDGQHPGALAPFGAGVVVSAVGVPVLITSGVSELATDPSDAAVTLAIAFGAPAAAVVLGLLTALPRRLRGRGLREKHPGAALVHVIVTPEVRRRLRLEDELRRSYTATFLFEPARISLWRGGSHPILVAESHGEDPMPRATSMRHAANRVAAVELAFRQSVLTMPVVRSTSAFNVPTGWDAVDRLCRSIGQDRGPSSSGE